MPDLCQAPTVDLVPDFLDLEPDLAILMLSAISDATTAATCMQRGAFDYLTKPIELNDLSSAIERALKRRDTFMQNREISSWLKEEVQRRTREVELEREKQQQLTLATLEALVNALEASPPNTTVDVDVAKVQEEQSAWARVRIRDRGPGIAAEMRAHLFEPFRSNKSKGTGLGLAIVHRIVEAHEGRVELVSLPAGGAEARVDLPSEDSRTRLYD